MDTNLNQTTKTKKLAISTTIKIDQQVNKNIGLPFFFRSTYGNRCMVTEQQKLIRVTFHSNYLYTIHVSEELSKYEFEDINSGQEITADEFFTALNAANKAISQHIEKIAL